MRAASFTLIITKITHTSEKHKNQENEENQENRKNTKTQKHTLNNLGCEITSNLTCGTWFRVFFEEQNALF